LEITEFQIDWLQSIDEQLETIDIDMELVRRTRGKSVNKYKDFTNNQLIAVRNHLGRKVDLTLERLINERSRIKQNSRTV